MAHLFFCSQLRSADACSSSGKLRGYLYKKSWFVEEMTKARDVLLLANKLPLVLDLDDTVLRAVGNDSKKVPPSVAQSGEGGTLLTIIC